MLESGASCNAKPPVKDESVSILGKQPYWERGADGLLELSASELKCLQCNVEADGSRHAHWSPLDLSVLVCLVLVLHLGPVMMGLPIGIAVCTRYEHGEAVMSAAPGNGSGGWMHWVPLATYRTRNVRSGRALLAGLAADSNSYLVDPASSHMLVSKIKPCMS